MRLSKEKLIILLTVLVDVIGVGVVIPVMPFFVQSLGASAMTITLLFAVFSLCSFFSAPILGALSDRFGRRPALIVSIASTALGWFVFGRATTVLMLFAGRIIDGMAAGNFPIAQSYLADISKSPQERTANMGLLGAAFGIGFVIGPALGSVLSQISISLPFYFVGALATLNTVAAYFFLPETNIALTHGKKISLNPFKPLITAAKDLALRSRYTAWFLFSLAIAIQQSIFALFMEHAFGLNASATGYYYVFIGLILAVNQGLFLKKFWLKRFKEPQLEVWLFPVFAVGFFIMAVPIFFWFMLGTILMVLGQSVLRAVMSSRITGFADPNKKGEVAGIMA
jgi:MFS transporter, DHA1 family, tetracycline resistance protein